jgi:hypothetical protein
MVQGLGLDYYHQQEVAASRAECDDFNRMHFSRQLESRGGQRAVTPKVQQEPLNGQRPATSAAGYRAPGTAQGGRQVGVVTLAPPHASAILVLPWIMGLASWASCLQTARHLLPLPSISACLCRV